MKRLSFLAFFLLASFLQASSFSQFQGNERKSGQIQETFSTLNDAPTLPLSPSPSATPVKFKNLLLIPLENGEIRAYDAFSLNLLWSKTLSGGKPLAVAAGQGVICIATQSGKIYGLNEAGTQIWFLDASSQLAPSLSFLNGKFYLGTSHPNYYFYEIDPATGVVTNSFFAGNSITGGASSDGTRLFFGAGDGKVYALNSTDFSLAFSFSTRGTLYHIAPAVDAGTLFFPASDFDRNLYALDAATGALKWQADLFPSASNIKVSSLAISSTSIYLQSAPLNGTAKLFSLDKNSGALRWAYDLGAIGNRNFLPAPLLLSDNPDKVAVAGTDGSLRVFDGNGTLLFSKAFSGEAMLGLAAASGTLYLLTSSGLYTYRDTDTSLPVAVISSPYANQKISSSVTITGTASDNHFVSYTLSYGAGTSPSSFTSFLTSYEKVENGTLGNLNTSALAEGIYTLKLEVKDIGENVKEARVQIQIDRTSPVLTITSPQDGLITKTTPLQVLGTTETGASVKVNNTSISVQPDGSFSAFVNLQEGSNTITVSATDEAGNITTITRAVTLDTVAPSLTLSSPPDGLLTNTPSLTVSGTVEIGATLTIQGANVSPDNQGAFSKALTLTEGSNTILVEAYDQAGNKSSASRQVTLDTTPPALTLLAPADQSRLTSSPVTVSGTAEIGAKVFVNNQAVALDGQGNFSSALSLSEGANTITVTARDPAGNETKKSITVTLDTQNPLLAISSPSNPYLTNQTPVTITGKSEEGASVTVNSKPVNVKNDGTFLLTWDLTEGENKLLFEARDQAGNRASLLLTITLDTIPPALTLTSPSDNFLTNQATINIDGTTEAEASLTINRTSVPHQGTFSFPFSLTEGENPVTVIATDRAGNKTEKKLTIKKDATPPQMLSLTFSSLTGLTATQEITVKGEAQDTGSGLATLFLSEKEDFSQASTFPLSSSPFSAPFTLSAGDGTKKIYAKVQDKAGNFSQPLFLSLLLDTKSYLEQPITLNSSAPQEFSTKDGTKVSLSSFKVDKANESKIFLIIKNPLVEQKLLPPPEDPDLKATDVIREIRFVDEKGAPVKVTLLEKALLTFPYSSTSNLNEESLRIFYYTPAGEYEILTGTQNLDKTARTVTAQTDHFSTFRLLSVLPQQNSLIAQSFLYPNPLSSQIAPTLSYKLKEDAASVTISFWTSSGQKIDELSLFQGQPGTLIGRNRLKLSSMNFSLPNGVYFYTISVTSLSGAKTNHVGKMVILR